MENIVESLKKILLKKALMLATAESCTGGWVSKILTDCSGSSAWFERGFVTYSNEAKVDMLGIPLEVIEREGAVSQVVAKAMAEGVLKHSKADVALAITGIAGPDGGTAQKPVGLVWFAWAKKGAETKVKRYVFAGDREAVRHHAVFFALNQLLSFLQE